MVDVAPLLLDSMPREHDGTGSPHIPESAYLSTGSETQSPRSPCRLRLMQSDGTVQEMCIEDALTWGTQRTATSDVEWLDVENPSLEDMKRLQETFSIHPLTTEDCLSNGSEIREKWEMFDDYIFVVIGSLSFFDEWADILGVRPANCYILVFSNFLITFHSHDYRPPLSHVVKRIRSTKRKRMPSADWVMYIVMDEIVNCFIPCANQLTVEADALDELVLMLPESEQEDVLRRIGLARRRVHVFRRFISPKRDIVMGMIQREVSFLSKESRIYLRDVLDGVIQMLEKSDAANDTVNSSHSNYLARISIDVARASHKINVIVKVLSGVATLMLPFSLVAGLFGMNVRVPGQYDGEGLRGDSLWPFTGICLFMVVSIFFVTLFFLRRGWM